MLSQAVKYLKELPVKSVAPLLREGFRHVSFHAEHLIDLVKNCTKIFFGELIGLAAHHFHQGVQF